MDERERSGESRTAPGSNPMRALQPHVKLVCAVTVYMRNFVRPQVTRSSPHRNPNTVGLQCGLHIDRVPDNHGIGQQIQTGRLVTLPFLMWLAHPALPCKEEKFAQIMQFLTLVELGTNAMTQGAIFQIAQHKNRFDKPPILLEEPGEMALSGVGLQSTDEEGGGDIPTFE